MIHLFVFWRDWFINICTLLLIELGSLLCCEHHQNIGYFILLYSVVLYCAHTHCIDLCEVNTHLKQKKKVNEHTYACTMLRFTRLYVYSVNIVLLALNVFVSFCLRLHACEEEKEEGKWDGRVVCESLSGRVLTSAYTLKCISGHCHNIVGHMLEVREIPHTPTFLFFFFLSTQLLGI